MMIDMSFIYNLLCKNVFDPSLDVNFTYFAVHYNLADGQDKQFIPNPTTWLNQERWDDEYVARITTTGNYLDNLFTENADVKKLGITK